MAVNVSKKLWQDNVPPLARSSNGTVHACTHHVQLSASVSWLDSCKGFNVVAAASGQSCKPKKSVLILFSNYNHFHIIHLG